MELRKETPYEASPWALSDQFFGWIFSLGRKVKITGTKEVVPRFAYEIQAAGKSYQRE